MAFLQKTTTKIPLPPSKIETPTSNIYPVLGFIGIISSAVAIFFLLALLLNAWPFAKTTAEVKDYQHHEDELDKHCSVGYEQGHHQSLLDHKKGLEIPKGSVPNGEIPCDHSKYFPRPTS
jgi:hypothetical protein